MCLELGREHFTIIFPLHLPFADITNPNQQWRENWKKKNTPLPSFQFIFYFSWKIPTEWVKKNLNVSWEHAVQDFGMGTSNEVGKGVKCVSGNSEETGSERLEIRQSFTFHSTTLGKSEYKAGSWHGLESEVSGTERREIPSICFLNYHPEDTGGKSQGIKIALEV